MAQSEPHPPAPIVAILVRKPLEDWYLGQRGRRSNARIVPWAILERGLRRPTCRRPGLLVVAREGLRASRAMGQHWSPTAASGAAAFTEVY